MSSSSPTILTTSLLFLLITPLAKATCFLPNGTAHTDPGTQPCSTDPANPLSAICCHTGWANPPGADTKYGATKDECLPNGLCQNRGFSTVPGREVPAWTHFYRVYCAVEDWSGCLSVCGDEVDDGGVMQLTPCDGTSSAEKWCCGNSTGCCGEGSQEKVVTIPRVLGGESWSSMSALTSSSAGSSLASASKSVSFLTSTLLSHTPSTIISGTASAPAVTNTASSAKDANRRRDIGLGVGIPAVLILGVIVGIYCSRRRRAKVADALSRLERRGRGRVRHSST